jgi:ABC-2 type transport system ATP-binding protein
VTATVTLRGVGKRYWQLNESPMLLRTLVPFRRPSRKERWALRDVDLQVEQGETVGIVGHNGAGKTTMLRLLAGVSRPTEGDVLISGRVAPLIGVGVGFHHEMTGRENVFVNGLLLGLTKRQVTERFEQIVDFAELWDFVDTPVKFYSSGMFMRLGFSVAIHSSPDILLVDEVLAVGDLSFQVKCLEQMRALQQEGTTILMVSHSMPAIRLLCPRAVLVHKGRLEFDGPTEDTIGRHHELLTVEHADGEGGHAVEVLDRILIGESGPTHHPGNGEKLVYRCRMRFHRHTDTPQVHFEVKSDDGTIAYSLLSHLGRDRVVVSAGALVELEIGFECRLGPGTYRIQLTVTDRSLREMLAHDAPGYMIFVASQPGRGGIADLSGRMSIDGSVVTDIGDVSLHRSAVDPVRPVTSN